MTRRNNKHTGPEPAYSTPNIDWRRQAREWQRKAERLQADIARQDAYTQELEDQIDDLLFRLGAVNEFSNLHDNSNDDKEETK